MSDRGRFSLLEDITVENGQTKAPDVGMTNKTPNGGNMPEKRWYEKHKWCYMLVVVMLMVLLILCFFPVSFGTVVIEGNDKLTSSDVYQAGQVKEPVNVLQVKTALLRENLSSDLRVQSVEVERQFPAIIRVKLIERKPLAVVSTQFGFAVLDKDCVVIELTTGIRGISVPIITGKKMGNILLGDALTAPDIRPVMTFLHALSPEAYNNIAEINIGNAKQLIAYTTDAVPVHLGDGSAMEARAELTENMLKDVRKRKMAVDFIETDLQSPYIRIK